MEKAVEVKRGEILALLVSNGEGKTAIAGLSDKSTDGAGVFAKNQPVTSIVVNKNIK